MKQVRHVRAIIALPFLVVVVVPTLLVWQTGGPNAVWRYSRPLDLIITIVGALLIIDGLFVLGLTIRLFMKKGEGKSAAWKSDSARNSALTRRTCRGGSHV